MQNIAKKRVDLSGIDLNTWERASNTFVTEELILRWHFVNHVVLLQKEFC